MTYYSHNLHIIQIINNRLKEHTFLVTQSENVTT